ncbi:MAG: DUF3179 domain-containing protein [Acidobacteria bacterium]|nr:DUF3179 domain-containing protein [Acidobacteriota bacterium]
MTRRVSVVFFLACAVAVNPWDDGTLGGQSVRTESERKLLPAGKGQEPFDVTRRTIPISEIQGGGPPRDGIPALSNPQFMTAHDADRLLSRQDRILGVFLNGEAKAYPVRILTWHELVNDRVGGRAILVSW